MPDFYCTFGCGQELHPGYVKITAKDHYKARELMFEKYGREWCTSYSKISFLSNFDRIERDHIIETPDTGGSGT